MLLKLEGYNLIGRFIEKLNKGEILELVTTQKTEIMQQEKPDITISHRSQSDPVNRQLILDLCNLGIQPSLQAFIVCYSFSI